MCSSSLPPSQQFLLVPPPHKLLSSFSAFHLLISFSVPPRSSSSIASPHRLLCREKLLIIPPHCLLSGSSSFRLLNGSVVPPHSFPPLPHCALLRSFSSLARIRCSSSLAPPQSSSVATPHGFLSSSSSLALPHWFLLNGSFSFHFLIGSI
jgi:hypothetical protein